MAFDVKFRRDRFHSVENAKELRFNIILSVLCIWLEDSSQVRESSFNMTRGDVDIETRSLKF